MSFNGQCSSSRAAIQSASQKINHKMTLLLLLIFLSPLNVNAEPLSNQKDQVSAREGQQFVLPFSNPGFYQPVLNYPQRYDYESGFYQPYRIKSNQPNWKKPAKKSQTEYNYEEALELASKLVDDYINQKLNEPSNNMMELLFRELSSSDALLENIIEDSDIVPEWSSQQPSPRQGPVFSVVQVIAGNLSNCFGIISVAAPRCILRNFLFGLGILTTSTTSTSTTTTTTTTTTTARPAGR